MESQAGGYARHHAQLVRDKQTHAVSRIPRRDDPPLNYLGQVWWVAQTVRCRCEASGHVRKGHDKKCASHAAIALPTPNYSSAEQRKLPRDLHRGAALSLIQATNTEVKGLMLR